MFDRIAINGLILAGRDEKDSVQDFRPTGHSTIQKIMPLRASQPTWVDRGTKSTEFSFTACRKHDSIPAAAIFIFDHIQELTYVGTIDLLCEYDGKKIARRGQGCIKQVGVAKRIGLSTFIQYEMEIGTTAIPT